MSDDKCSRCGRVKHRGRCKGGGVKCATEPVARAAAEPIKLNGSLEIAAGLGIRASLENGQLQLEQDRQEGDMVYTHTISLAPHEARELIDFVERHVNRDRAEG